MNLTFFNSENRDKDKIFHFTNIGEKCYRIWVVLFIANQLTLIGTCMPILITIRVKCSVLLSPISMNIHAASRKSVNRTLRLSTDSPG